MKKRNLICGVLIGILTFSSCSSDDENDDSGTDSSIIGTWKRVIEVDVCSNGSEEVYHFTPCEQTGRRTFSENGTATITQYSEFNGDCYLDYDITPNYTIEGNNIIYSQQGEEDNIPFFNLENDILQIGYFDTGISGPCNVDFETSYYYTEFIRVQE